MENEIKVGEYVRTPEQGFIGKLVEINNNVLNYYKIDVGREVRRTNGMSDNYIYSRDGFGLKHSFNIFDIIEVGDIGKFYMEDDVDEEDTNWFEIIAKCEDTKELRVMNKDYQADFFPIENLREILTKEMMESISYKVTKM